MIITEFTAIPQMGDKKFPLFSTNFKKTADSHLTHVYPFHTYSRRIDVITGLLSTITTPDIARPFSDFGGSGFIID